MNARGTDWSLAALVTLLALTGALTLFGGAWVFGAHDITGFALSGVLVFKLRRVWRRIGTRRAGLIALLFVALTLLTGIAWSSAAKPNVFGYNPLNFHSVFGAVLAAAVLTHAVGRAKRPRRGDLTRRQVLASAGVGLGAVALWQLQRTPGLASAKRRFTGSYEVASFEGNAFPSTSWVADAPRPLTHATLQFGDRRLTAAELDAGDELTATLDCTGGFYSTQVWRGTRLDRLLGDAPGSHVRVISHTGYRWSFDRADAARLLLATHVGGEPLSHGHGAPVRLVAPGERGFIWVKWVTRVELHDGPDPGAFASTLWSSLTARGRGS
ncbi:molybdopterin-dependent oxidoreductase [Solirubrobacter soli]|uniref:molybdopterin-dependent oxidoreductase n=1 Tax=Solirubrobacter soli TaxID=363832 RepID=UPI0003F73744|nr:molybdopterin-dependent oxidoreductase [Solirubrobacter soli]